MAFTAFREGRLTLSPRRWLIDLRHLHGVMRSPEARRKSRRRPSVPHLDVFRDVLAPTATTELQTFLASGQPLELVSHPVPLITVVVVLFNRAELTFRCLRALTTCTLPMEIVIVDNASTDSTSDLLTRVQGAKIVQQASNKGFGPGVNAGAGVATGKYLLLLNSDAEVLPGAIEEAGAAAE